MATGIFNPPLLQPSEHLGEAHLQRAAALTIAQQVLSTPLASDLVALAEYIVNGGGGYFVVLTETDELEARQERRAEQTARRMRPVPQAVPEAWPTLPPWPDGGPVLQHEHEPERGFANTDEPHRVESIHDQP